GVDELPGKTNYFLGNDSTKWTTNVSSFSKVEYHNLYPGIDAVYYGTNSQKGLEYDLVVSPGADPSAVKLSFTGADGTSVDSQGNLVLHTAAGDVVQKTPSVYQQVGAAKVAVAGRYALATDGSASFQVGAYDRSKALVVDPELTFSTFLGGSGWNDPYGIAVD